MGEGVSIQLRLSSVHFFLVERSQARENEESELLRERYETRVEVFYSPNYFLAMPKVSEYFL